MFLLPRARCCCFSPPLGFGRRRVFLWGRGLCRGENGGVVAEGWCVVCGVWLVVWLVVDDALGGE